MEISASFSALSFFMNWLCSRFISSSGIPISLSLLYISFDFLTVLHTTKILLFLYFSFINSAFISLFSTFTLCLISLLIKGSVVIKGIFSFSSNVLITPGKVAVIMANFPPKSVIYFIPKISEATNSEEYICISSITILE